MAHPWQPFTFKQYERVEFLSTFLSEGVKVTVPSPSAVRITGIRKQLGAVGGIPLASCNFGSIKLYFTEDPRNPQATAHFPQASYCYLPHAGDWFLFIAAAGIPSAIDPDVTDWETDLLAFTVLENVSPEVFNALVHDTRPSHAYTSKRQILPAPVAYALNADGAADSYYTLGGSPVLSGRFCHIIGAHISNVGGNFVYISFGDYLAFGANGGVPLNIRQSIYYPAGTLSGLQSIYAYTDLGSTVVTTWFVK